LKALKNFEQREDSFVFTLDGLVNTIDVQSDPDKQKEEGPILKEY